MVHLSTFARLSQRQIASLSLSLPPLASTPSASDAVIQPRGALTPGVLSQLGRPHALQAPCLTPIPRLRWFRLASGRLIRTPPTFSCQPSPANLLLPTFSCQPSPANLLLPTFSCQPSPANLLLPTSPCLKRPLSPLAPGHAHDVFPLRAVARLLHGPVPSANGAAPLP